MRKQSSYKKHEVKADYKNKRVDVARFTNFLMKGGEKIVAERVMYGALENIKNKTNDDPLKTFEQAIQNASPILQVISRRVGGANYQIPSEVRPERKFFLAAHWIIDAARKRKGKPMAEKLAEELLAAAKHEGTAIKKKQDTHRMAEANRAFASFLRR